jgi:hypothetical protein
MTLILTLPSARYVLQVSDRLTTRAQDPFDRHSNKNVIFLARDALVSIGYSGHAYLNGVPTDQWIAQTLRGEDLSRPEERGTFTVGRVARWLDIGESVELLRREYERVFSSPPMSIQKSDQLLVLAGWQWNRRLTRPIALAIHNTDSDSRQTFKIERSPRHWKRGQFYIGQIPSSHLSTESLEELLVQLRQVLASPDKTESLLISTVRRVANESTPAVIGQDCMSILLPPPSSHTVLVRYVPLVEERAVITHGRLQRQVPVAFSPFIIGCSDGC